MAGMIRNLLFIVEGQTEGLANAFGKGLQNILRNECDFMRQHHIRFSTIRKNGKHDLLSNVNFDVSQHLNPPKKLRAKLEQRGSAPGDWMYILRGLDCEDEDVVQHEIFEKITPESHNRVEVHFAVQEIEAWIIADPDNFYRVYNYAPRQLLNDVKQLVPEGQSPEIAINCNPKPSERLENLTRKHDRTYRKTIEGPKALDLVNPDYIADRCPHFRDFRQSLRTKIGWP